MTAISEPVKPLDIETNASSPRLTINVASSGLKVSGMATSSETTRQMFIHENTLPVLMTQGCAVPLHPHGPWIRTHD